MARKPRPKDIPLKRYQLVISMELWNKLSARAKQEGSSVLTQILRCVKVGLFLYKHSQHGAQIVMRETSDEGTTDTKIEFL